MRKANLIYKLKKSILPISVIIWFIITLYVLIMVFFPFNIVQVEDPIKILNENHNVRRGENLILQITYNKKFDIPTKNVRTLQCKDGSIVTLTPSESNLPKGEHTVIGSNFPVPDRTPLTQCKLILTVTYTVSPIRNITISHGTEYFNVIE